MKNILITGGAGFIGSHTCIPLLENGFNITILDSNVNSSQKSLEGILKIVKKKYHNNLFFQKGDIRNPDFLVSIFDKSKRKNKSIDAVIHFAGLKATGESVQKPLLYWDTNFNGTLNLLKVMNEFDCTSIVFSSSASIYGDNSNRLIKETSLIKPTNPYGNTKASVEIMLEDIFKSSKETWKIANLRYFNPIGAHESGMIGENPFQVPNNIFPLICLVARGKLEKINIFGNDWDTRDGTGIRDYIHVMDLADAHYLTLKYLLDNPPQFINLNIGTGIGTTVFELINKFTLVNDCNVPFQISKRRKGDVASLIADNQKALKLLNWEPKRDLEIMCKDGWRWHKLNPNGY